MMDHLLIRTARGESVERPPVWAMRQAGRWDPKFLALRQGLGFYEFSENVELSIECSLLPRRFGVDAIILFYDITTLPVSMGQPFTLRPNRGPVPDVAIRSMADVDRLVAEPTPDSFRHILDLLAGVKKKLAGELPVLVFAGAPFTVATYSIGTGKDLDATRRFVHENPATWHALLEKLEHATGHFLRALIAAGADAYQLFDSWAGMLEPTEYDAWAQPHHAAIFRAAAGCPRILFVKEGPYLAKMAETGADILSLGVRDDLAKARRDYPHLVFQGNVDEEILRTGTAEEVRAATRRCLEAGGGRRHIVNLNHGVDRTTPVANFQAFIETVKAYR
jgi:uroporphyrinogen decarboxylase